MVPAIGIVTIALYFLCRDENVLPVLPAPRIDVAADVLDLGRVAIRIITAAAGGIIRHVPCRIKLLVQRFILWWMAVLRRCGGDYENEPDRKVCPSHAFSSLSRMAPRRQQTRLQTRSLQTKLIW